MNGGSFKAIEVTIRKGSSIRVSDNGEINGKGRIGTNKSDRWLGVVLGWG